MHFKLDFSHIAYCYIFSETVNMFADEESKRRNKNGRQHPTERRKNCNYFVHHCSPEYDTSIDDLIKGKMVSAYFFLNTSPIKVFMGKSQPKTSECMGRNEAS